MFNGNLLRLAADAPLTDTTDAAIRFDDTLFSAGSMTRRAGHKRLGLARFLRSLRVTEFEDYCRFCVDQTMVPGTGRLVCESVSGSKEA